MSIISTTKELIDLAKKGATLELELRLIKMQENELELREEIVKLKTEISELKESVKLSNTLEFADGMYILDGGYYCHVCKDADNKLIRLQKEPYSDSDEYEREIQTGTKYWCAKCYFSVKVPDCIEEPE